SALDIFTSDTTPSIADSSSIPSTFTKAICVQKSLDHDKKRSTDEAASASEDTDTLSEPKGWAERFRCATLRDPTKLVRHSVGMAALDSSAPETTSSDNSPATSRRPMPPPQTTLSQSTKSPKSIRKLNCVGWSLPNKSITSVSFDKPFSQASPSTTPVTLSSSCHIVPTSSESCLFIQDDFAARLIDDEKSSSKGFVNIILNINDLYPNSLV
ncbi:unnamed protein product, partial [Protopolystoma xenopodis]